MIAPAAYILLVPEDRRSLLLDSYQEPGMFSPVPMVAEPVPRFDHSSRAPLVVFCSFAKGEITHIADGRKGASAGTGLVRLNLASLEELENPIKFSALLKRLPRRYRRHVEARLKSGGKLPPKSLGALVDAILDLRPDLAKMLDRFSERRAQRLGRLRRRSRRNLAEQKETLSTALEIAGIDGREVLSWSPAEETPRLFLEGLPQVYLREDAVLISDFTQMPGFDVIKEYPFAAKEFQAAGNSAVRLKVLMANRLPLEEQTGADLIYYNETFRSFVLVQYKSMEHGKNGASFRWRPGDKLAEEVARMDNVLESLAKEPMDPSAASFRLHANPFFLKLCPRLIFNPDDKGLSKGMYLPLDFWKSLASDVVTLGSRGGRLITYENVGRKFTNSQFVDLVAQAWVGTTAPQSILLESVIKEILETGKTITLAVKQAIPPRAMLPEDESEDEDQDESDQVDPADSF